ncbi:hypothetical protein Nepgr_002295 [Nepenthes gracilis]|uniref:Uncharacterized protein n=1 Tax=Nepenthes gracilis TaxID=150966 RepID=A0AAD3RY71_NEPGR|nr:hypothetical protein Nepgr_002295 [Nepenthes gracilis]
MFPSYGFSPLCPHQRGQMPVNEYFHPRWNAFSSQMTVDAVNSPPMSPYPHSPSLPRHHHCWRGHPAYPDPYAVHQSPPHHTMKQPRYEYDKKMLSE